MEYVVVGTKAGERKKKEKKAKVNVKRLRCRVGGIFHGILAAGI
jgi:hypothetical protein